MEAKIGLALSQSSPVEEQLLDVTEAEGSEEQPLIPLQPVLQCYEPQLLSASATSATFRWDPADWHLEPHDDRQAEFQQHCVYSLQQGLAVQLVDVGSPSPTTEQQLLLSVPDKVSEDGWKLLPSTAPPVQQPDGSLQLAVTGLRAGRYYGARVVATVSVCVDDGPLLEFPPNCSAVVGFRTSPTPPGQMQAPALAQRARNALKLKWNAPDETGGEAITAYELMVAPQPAGWEGGPPDEQGFAQVYVGDERNYKLGKLGPGQRFQFKIRSFNALGHGPWSLPSTFTTQPSVPAQPDPPVQIAASKDSSTLQWHAPADNGSLISCYQLEVDDGRQGEFRLAYTGLEQHCVVKQLQSGLHYRFRLRAENSEGYSLWSAVSSATTAATAPGSPVGLGVVGINRTSATLAWQPPAHDGGSVVQSYQVQLQAKTKTAAAALGHDWIIIFEGSSCATTFSALQPGCQYLVRVAAQNTAGQGQFCLPLQLTTAADVPLPPSLPEAEIAATSLLLRWSAPTHDGGAAVAGYKVEMRCSPAASGATGAISPQHSLAIPEHFLGIYSGPDMCVQVTDLLPGTAYEFRAAALNSHGASAWSEIGTATTLPAAPLPPPAPQLTASSSSSLSVVWKEPYGQGSPVTSYTLNMARLGPVYSSNSSSSNSSSFTGHMNGSADPQVHPASESHDDAASSSSGSQPAADKLRWETVYTGPGMSADVKHLKPASRYALRVRAHNSIGGSSWGEVLTASTSPAAPCPPCALTATAMSSQVMQLSWQPPLEDNGAAVVAYQLEVATVTASVAVASSSWSKIWHGPGNVLQHEVDGLQPGRSYSWRARALNSCGAGSWGEAVRGSTLPAEPGPLGRPVVMKREATSVRLKWSIPLEDNGASVTNFLLQLRMLHHLEHDGSPVNSSNGQLTWKLVYSGSDTQYKVNGLQPGSCYELRVAAVNSVGAGPWSDSSSVVTQLRPPPPPCHLSAVLEGAAPEVDGPLAVLSPVLLVSWAPAPAGPECAEVVSYEVEASPAAAGNAVPVVRATAKLTTSSIAGLQPGFAYNVRVRSVGAEGTGHSSWSSVETVVVPALSPAPASDDSRESLGGSSVTGAVVFATEGAGKKAKGRKGKAAREAAAAAAAEKRRNERGGGRQATARKPPKKSQIWDALLWDRIPHGQSAKKYLKKHKWHILAVLILVVCITLGLMQWLARAAAV